MQLSDWDLQDFRTGTRADATQLCDTASPAWFFHACFCTAEGGNLPKKTFAFLCFRMTTNSRANPEKKKKQKQTYKKQRKALPAPHGPLQEVEEVPPSSAAPHVCALHSSSLQPTPKPALADPHVPHRSIAVSPAPVPVPAMPQRGRDTPNNPGIPKHGPTSEAAE